MLATGSHKGFGGIVIYLALFKDEYGQSEIRRGPAWWLADQWGNHSPGKRWCQFGLGNAMRRWTGLWAFIPSASTGHPVPSVLNNFTFLCIDFLACLMLPSAGPAFIVMVYGKDSVYVCVMSDWLQVSLWSSLHHKISAVQSVLEWIMLHRQRLQNKAQQPQEQNYRFPMESPSVSQNPILNPCLNWAILGISNWDKVRTRVKDFISQNDFLYAMLLCYC